MKIKQAFCSLLLASSTGLIVGLLLAPDKGAHTRKKIRQEAERFREDKIIGYNRKIGILNTKLDEICKLLLIQSTTNPKDWADSDQKTKIII